MKKELAVQESKNVDTKKAVQLVRILYPYLERVPDIEIQKAISLCRHLGLDPLKKEVHFVPFGGSIQLVVSYTEYIKRAERSGKLNGWSIKFEGKTKQDLKAIVTIYRKDWQYPFEWTVYFSEVERDTPTWKSMPLFMLRKCAISQAFRLAFPEETASLPYEEAEILGELTTEKEDIPVEPVSIEEEKEKVDTITGEVIEGETSEEMSEISEEEISEEKFEEKTETKTVERKLTDEQLKKIVELFNKVGIEKDRGLRLSLISSLLERKISNLTDLTQEEAQRVILHLQEYLRRK